MKKVVTPIVNPMLKNWKTSIAGLGIMLFTWLHNQGFVGLAFMNIGNALITSIALLFSNDSTIIFNHKKQNDMNVLQILKNDAQALFNDLGNHGRIAAIVAKVEAAIPHIKDEVNTILRNSSDETRINGVLDLIETEGAKFINSDGTGFNTVAVETAVSTAIKSNKTLDAAFEGTLKPLLNAVISQAFNAAREQANGVNTYADANAFIATLPFE